MRTILSLILTYCFACIFIAKVYSQEEISLSTLDVKSYKLAEQIFTDWPINEDSIKEDAIKQTWKRGNKEMFQIIYCTFQSESEAFKSTSYAANSLSIPFLIGTPSGEILGDNCWVSIERCAVYIQINNIGFKVFKPFSLNLEDIDQIFNISNEIISNIKKHNNKTIDSINLSLSENEYTNIIKKSVTHLSDKKFEKFETENTNWILFDNSLITGHREQWKTNNSIVSIDLFKSDNINDIQDAVKIKNEYNNYIIFNFDERNSIENGIKSWQSKWSPFDTIKYFSGIGIKKPYLISLYYFDEKGINTNDLLNILELIKNEEQ